MNIEQRIQALTPSQLEVLSQRLNVASDEPSSAKQLVAYVVGDDLLPPTADELRSLVAKSLPAYMVPQKVVFINHIPLTPNGKADIKALQTGDDQDQVGELLSYSEPRDDLEQVVVNVWADVLAAEVVGINDNYFEIGGDSMLAAALVSHLREALEVQIPLGYLFEAPTVAGLSEKIRCHVDDKETLMENATLYLQLQSMSDDEVDAMLAQQQSTE